MTSIVVLLLTALLVESSKVLEVSDKFLPLRHDGLWLMKFYAPWCGHCKKLEPVWKHVAQSLGDTPIRVARVDCTRFPKVATEFSIRGYPTIMFLKGDNVYTYEGDRTREDIVAFARRMSGPPVKHLSSPGELSSAMLNTVIFIYSGPVDHPLYAEFLENAKHFQQDEHMYSVSPGLLAQHVSVASQPVVLVYKDKTFTEFLQEKEEEVAERTVREVEVSSEPPTPSVVNTSLYSWVTRERFPLFAKVTRGRFGKFLATNKYVVIAVVEENKLSEVSEEMLEFKEMVRRIVVNNQDLYGASFQFGWTGSPDLANSVAMDTLTLPNLIVINSTTYQHHLPEDSPEYLTAEAIKIFLDSILSGDAPSYGGSSWLVRLYRSYYEAKTSLVEMWRGNPVLTAVLLGLPLGFLSLIFYSICCADIMDADEEEEEEGGEELYHEKAE